MFGISRPCIHVGLYQYASGIVLFMPIFDNITLYTGFIIRSHCASEKVIAGSLYWCDFVMVVRNPSDTEYLLMVLCFILIAHIVEEVFMISSCVFSYPDGSRYTPSPFVPMSISVLLIICGRCWSSGIIKS